MSHGPNCCCGDFELVTVWVSHPCFHINLKIIFFFSLLFVWTYNFTTTELASIFPLFQAWIEFLSYIFALSHCFIWQTYFISVFIFFISQFFPSFIGFRLNTAVPCNSFAWTFHFPSRFKFFIPLLSSFLLSFFEFILIVFQEEFSSAHNFIYTLHFPSKSPLIFLRSVQN